jgi:hypothetical protein
MKAKLIKVGNHYDLYHRIAEEDLIIGFASTDNTFEKKLSFKNCQSIEQQFPTERMWDVEVEMKDVVQLKNRTGGLTNMGELKLDSDGYLILKII